MLRGAGWCLVVAGSVVCYQLTQRSIAGEQRRFLRHGGSLNETWKGFKWFRSVPSGVHSDVNSPVHSQHSQVPVFISLHVSARAGHPQA